MPVSTRNGPRIHYEVYGEGLRRVIRYVDENGVAAWLRLARTRHDFPEGY